MITSFRIFLTLAFVLVVGNLLAQPGPPPNPDAPLTGIEILVGVGVLFGAKKIFEMRRNKK